MTHGRPRSCTDSQPALRSRARHAGSPATTSTSTPASRSRSTPPPLTFGFGSRTPTTTRSTPASRSASVHGGVDPWCVHGSSEMYIVDRRARSPASRSAFTSACGVPRRSCQPSPTTSPSRTTTAPTSGFGYVVPRPRSASSIARSIVMSSRERGHKAPGGARQILHPEDARASDEQARARLVELAHVVGPDAAVDLDQDVGRQQLTQRVDALDRIAHELLARVPRMDAHAQHEIESVRGGGCVLDGRLGIEGQPDGEPTLARLRRDGLRIV